ncbi:hypothetical protein F8O01_09850 [Pseudoclavibacter chungangensis]|uniref:Uncharacterized protein n=1 Tax=Pseudoclavibacter chungangensis TaxID=587635 RepID=A0A7J5BQT6_9MICO|nr:hypothetical protein [Pseudoclavibacter chungangensis]KAB1656682.1 hypothetical protein F8O01_09850 [Pseudoclavibacter chungangensis]NYJ67864.1 hypothetical protein [Pseudoclavibacter chungangensis]
MVKVRGSILRRIDERSVQTHPNATKHSTGVWRVHTGQRVLGWVRYLGEARRSYALYYDGIDVDGRQAWCRNFETLDAAAAWAVQHAAEIVGHTRLLGPSRVRPLAGAEGATPPRSGVPTDGEAGAVRAERGHDRTPASTVGESARVDNGGGCRYVTGDVRP